MKFVIINTDYAEFLRWLYAHHPGLEHTSYDAQMDARNASLFGVADFYSQGLRAVGHEAWEIHANNEAMQKAWAGEHRVRVNAQSAPSAMTRWLQEARRVAARTPLRKLKSVFRPLLQYSEAAPNWVYEVLEAQILHYQPDVILCQAMTEISGFFLRKIRPRVKAIIGQHPWPRFARTEYLGAYDLAVSSMPETVELFKAHGLQAELHRLGFGQSVLRSLDAGPPEFDVTFIGSFSGIHNTRVDLLEAVYDAFPQLKIWAPNMDALPPGSKLRRCHVGQAWGRDVYRILQRSKVTLNHHGEVAPSANNMRLYEATGVGAFLLTDWKPNLPDLFEPGREVAVYRNPGECIEQIRYYLAHESERAAIGRAGQRRTLGEHTYVHRMRELIEILGSRL